MPVAALSGCSGPNDSPEQDAVMSISSCTARGDDGQEMSVSEFGMFVTDTAGNLYPDNIRVLNRSGKWTFAEISLSDGDKGIYAYYPYNPSFSGGKMGLDARSQTDYLYSERTMVSGNAPSASITLYHLLSKVTFRMPAAVTAVRVADYSYSASYSLLTGSLEIKPEKGTISSGTGSLLLYPGDSPAMHVALVAGGHPYDFVMPAAVLPAGAQSIKSDINTVLNDIALPVFLGVMVMALAVGIGKNWRLINDENSEGNKKQGWMNVAYMVGYVLIAVTVISFCVGKIAGVSFSI